MQLAHFFIDRPIFATVLSVAIMVIGADTPQLFADVERVRAKILQVPLDRVFDTLQTYLGAEMRQAIGTTVFSGMLGVTLFGLFLTPVFYTVIRRGALTPGQVAGRPEYPPGLPDPRQRAPSRR